MGRLALNGASNPVRGRKPLLGRVRLGDIIRPREEKYGDLLVWSAANIDGAMRPVTRFVPINLPGADFDLHIQCAVTELNGQSLAAEYDGHAMERIAMPSRGLPRRQH